MAKKKENTQNIKEVVTVRYNALNTSCLMGVFGNIKEAKKAVEEFTKDKSIYKLECFTYSTVPFGKMF